ncbi:GGDEF domain-containing protein [Pseudomonadota bacterium]
MLKSIHNYLVEVNNSVRLLELIFATFLMGVVDYFSGPELSFSLFYTGPVMLAVWYGGHRHGLVVSFFSAVVWLIAEIAVGREYSHMLTLIWNTIVRLAFFILVMELLLSVRDKVTTLESLASTDPLTGLVNRRFFLEQLERECARVRRYPEIFTIAYLDLDNFKYVNDTNGHLVGDELLQCVGEVLKSNLRESDMAARLGGDEFAVFFPTMRESTSKQVIEKLHVNLLNAMEEKGWPVTFSIGVVTYIEPLANIREMVKMADDLMYKVKKSGKDNICHIVSSNNK